MAISFLSAELVGFVVETVFIGMCAICHWHSYSHDDAFYPGAYFAVFLLGLHALFAKRFRHGTVGNMLWSPLNLSYFLIFVCVTGVSDQSITRRLF